MALASLCACDDEKKHGHAISLGGDTTPGLAPVANGREGATDAGAYTMAEVFDAEARAGSTPPSGTPQPEVPAAAAPAATAPAAAPAGPKVNPDDAILERTRVACGSCFSSLPAGAGYGPPTRSAHVSVTVIPTGSVSRADVSSNDTTDKSVLDCVQRTAQGATFSDNGGGPLRTYAIDVRVSAPGANGSR